MHGAEFKARIGLGAAERLKTGKQIAAENHLQDSFLARFRFRAKMG
jgi:hypothetical protein